MTANDYYTGAQNFPPHPQGNHQAPPPPYNANYGQAQQPPPPPSPQPGANKRDFYPPPQPGWAPWQQSYNSPHHPSQHYYGSSHQYSPQVGHGSNLSCVCQFAKADLRRVTHQQQPPQQQYPQNHPYPNQANGYIPQQITYPPPPQQQQQQPIYDDRPHKHHHRHQKHSKKNSHESRDSFLGAGAGGIIGDVLLGPGVGTLGGALIGALSGNAHAKKKSRSRSRDSR